MVCIDWLHCLFALIVCIRWLHWFLFHNEMSIFFLGTWFALIGCIDWWHWLFALIGCIDLTYRLDALNVCVYTYYWLIECMHWMYVCTDTTLVIRSEGRICRTEGQRLFISFRWRMDHSSGSLHQEKKSSETPPEESRCASDWTGDRSGKNRCRK